VKKNRRLAVLPLGIKRSRYELDARAALLALMHNTAKEQHLIDLYCLAKLCEAVSKEPHIKAHVGSIERLCEEIYHADYKVTALQYVAIAASTDMLIDFFNKQPNALIARTALYLAGKMAA